MRYFWMAVQESFVNARRLVNKHSIVVFVAIFLVVQMPVNAQTTQRDCFGDYERIVNAAWQEYDSCCMTFNNSNTSLSTWQIVSGKMSCRITWVAKVESAMFQFIACSTIPIK